MRDNKYLTQEEMDLISDALAVFGGDFSFKRRLQYIRCKRHLNKKELGILCGFPEKDADKRIRQYEAGERYPKDEIMSTLCDKLRISKMMLSMKSDDLQTGLFLHILWSDIFNNIDVFEATKEYKYLDDDIYRIDTNVESNVPGIVPNSETPLFRWLNELCLKQSQYKRGVITLEQLQDWEYSWEPRYR